MMEESKKEKVMFIGMIDMPHFKPMETVIFYKKDYGMAMIEHPQGIIDNETGKYVLLVDVKRHLTTIS